MKEEEEQTASRKKILFKKHKGFMKAVQQKAEFKDPVVILMRRGRKTEFYEDVKAGEWLIQHSDGKDRTLFIDPQFIRTFDYGSDKFTGYIMHEDHPLPLPEDPTITTELTGMTLEKTLHDIKAWKAKEIRANAELVKTIGMVIAIIIGGYILYRLLIPQAPPVVEKVIVETAKTVAENTTETVINRPVTII